MERDTGSVDVEATLERAFGAPMPWARRASVDRRVAAALAAFSDRQTSARSDRFPRIDRRAPRRRLLVVGAIFVVLAAGTVSAGGSLFERLTTHPSLVSSAWERGTRIGRSATDAGYTITVERATVDRDRIWIALSSATQPGDDASPARMEVIDANGTVFSGGTGVAIELPGRSAQIFGMVVPQGTEPTGPYTFKVSSVISPSTGRERWGTWIIRFDAPLTTAPPR